MYYKFWYNILTILYCIPNLQNHHAEQWSKLFTFVYNKTHCCTVYIASPTVMYNLNDLQVKYNDHIAQYLFIYRLINLWLPWKIKQTGQTIPNPIPVFTCSRSSLQNINYLHKELSGQRWFKMSAVPESV